MEKKEFSAETVVLESDYAACMEVRSELVYNFAFIWVFLYPSFDKKSGKITVTNAFGGKLNQETIDNINIFVGDWLKSNLAKG